MSLFGLASTDLLRIFGSAFQTSCDARSGTERRPDQIGLFKKLYGARSMCEYSMYDPTKHHKGVINFTGHRTMSKRVPFFVVVCFSVNRKPVDDF